MITYTNSLAGVRADQLAAFFEGWTNRPSPEAHLRILSGSSHVVLAAAPDGQVVGFATAISDGVLTAYVPLLEVLPTYRRQGIGRELIRRLLRQLGDLYSISLHCDPELQGFYESLGLRALGGMAIRNYSAQSGQPAMEPEIRASSSPGVRVRAAVVADSEQLADLLGQLGYPTRAALVCARLAAVAHERAAIIVAERDDVLIGLGTAHVFASIHSDEPVGWITTLVVASGARGQGIGRALVTAIEEWARAAGCARVSVLTGIHRADAHAFYSRLGYQHTGLRYTRVLVPGG